MAGYGFARIVPKSMFFDRTAVKSALSRGRHAALGKIGAFVRQRARTLTNRRSKASAAPGQPPKKHVGLLHDLIFFAYDQSHDSVVIGPVLFRPSDDVIAINGGKSVPEVLEFGGEELLLDRRSKARKHVSYEPRPFMGPSLTETQNNGKLVDAWRDCLIA